MLQGSKSQAWKVALTFLSEDPTKRAQISKQKHAIKLLLISHMLCKILDRMSEFREEMNPLKPTLKVFF